MASAPSLPGTPAIHWSVLPKSVHYSPSFFQSPGVRKTAQMTLFGLSFLSGGATLFAAVAFKAKPMTILRTTQSFAFMSAAFLAGAIGMNWLSLPHKTPLFYCSNDKNWVKSSKKTLVWATKRSGKLIIPPSLQMLRSMLFYNQTPPSRMKLSSLNMALRSSTF